MKDLAPSPHVYRFGQFEADVDRGKLSSRGVTVRLPEQSFSALALLLEHHGEIVTREEFRREIWPEGTFVEFEGSLNAILKRLRAALDDDADNPRFIETLPKRGYRFIAPVTAVISGKGATSAFAGATIEHRDQPDVLLAESNSAATTDALAWRRWLAVGAIVAMSVCVGYIALRGRLRSAGAAPGVATPEAVMGPVFQRRAIAVLGFQNATGKADDAWLSTALSEMLSTELAAGNKLRLVSGEDIAHLRTSSPWSQTDTLGAETTSRIGTALGSNLLVLGSYTAAGNGDNRQIRVDARLQDSKSGEILTEVAVVGSDQNLFELVSRVGGLLRDRLGISPVPAAEELSVSASLPSNMQASRFYSLGLEKLRDFDYRTAKELFDQAIHADPKFPLAHAMASLADLALGFQDAGKQEAKLGRDLSEKLSPVQKMEIEASYYEAFSDHAKAADTYHVLFTLYPDNLDYGLQLANSQAAAFKLDEAVETIRQLRQLPGPSKDDPRIDLLEGWTIVGQDRRNGDRLYHAAAAKASAQGKRLIFAKAEQRICLNNLERLSNPPECGDAYNIFLAAGNRVEAGACLQDSAEAQRLTGHDDASIPLYEQSLRIFEEAGARARIAVVLNNLSLVLEDEGKWNEAEARYLQSKKNFEEVNDRASLSAVISNLGDIQGLRGNLTEAANLYRQAWELKDSTTNQRDNSGHVNYGALLTLRGEIQSARQEIEPAINYLRQANNDPWQLYGALSAMGDVELAAGDLESARKLYQEGLDVMKKGNAPTQIPQLSLADLDTEEGHAANAEQAARQAAAELEKIGSAGDEISGYQVLARALLAQGNISGAQDSISRAMTLGEVQQFAGINLPLRISHARITMASAAPGAAGSAALADASRELTAVIAQAKSKEMYQYEIDARLALGELHMKMRMPGAQGELKALAAETDLKGYKLISRKANALLTSASSSAER